MFSLFYGLEDFLVVNSQSKRFTEIAIGSSLEDSFYDTIHPCTEPEPPQIVESSINQNSSVDQVDVSLSSGKVTNNQSQEIKPSESVAEEFEKFTEAVKEKVSSGTSTGFNKTLQKFIKLYERFTENQKITAFLNFDSIFVGKLRNRIKVQPTAVSRRKSKNGSRQKQSNELKPSLLDQ